MDKFLLLAIEEAKNDLAEGGIPIGSVLVHNEKIIDRGHYVPKPIDVLKKQRHAR